MSMTQTEAYQAAGQLALTSGNAVYLWRQFNFADQQYHYGYAYDLTGAGEIPGKRWSSLECIANGEWVPL